MKNPKLSTIILQVSKKIEKGLGFLAAVPELREENETDAVYFHNGLVRAKLGKQSKDAATIERCYYNLSKQRLSEASAKRIAPLFRKFIFEAGLPIYSMARRLGSISSELIMDCHRGDHARNAEK